MIHFFLGLAATLFCITSFAKDSITISIEGDVSLKLGEKSVSFGTVDSGICDYSFASTMVQFQNTTGAVAYLDILHDENEADNQTVICKKEISKYHQLRCTRDGNQFHFHAPVLFDFTSPTPKTINVIFED